jgi:DNA-directed RNA polymerase sigma subunit (sigma70/sigma32)
MTHAEARKRSQKIVAAARATDATADELAARFGISAERVRYFCKKAGVALRRPTTKTSRPVRSMQILKALFDPSQSMLEIAQQLGISKQRVSQVYQEALKVKIPGLPSRRPGIPKDRSNGQQRRARS